MAGMSIYFNHAQSVVSFDARKINGQFIRQLALHKATEDQVVRASLQFKTLLGKTVKSYSQKHHVVILDSTVLVAGGHDVTDAIAKELANAMRATS